MSSPQDDPTQPARRTVLRGIAAVGTLGAGAGLLAACGGGSSSDAAAKTTAAAPSSAAPSSAAPSSAASSGAAPAAALAKTSDIPVGGGKIFKEAGVVVTQPTAGSYKGFSSICTHMHCPLASVAGGTINCNCHGSKFSVADGSVKGGPAPAPLPAVAITVTGTDITKA